MDSQNSYFAGRLRHLQIIGRQYFGEEAELAHGGADGSKFVRTSTQCHNIIGPKAQLATDIKIRDRHRLSVDSMRLVATTEGLYPVLGSLRIAVPSVSNLRTV